MSAETAQQESRKLAQMLFGFGIRDAGHPALHDRESLGKYLVSLHPPESRREGVGVDEWREQRRTLSQAGVEKLREALQTWKDRSPAKEQSAPAPPPLASAGPSPPPISQGPVADSEGQTPAAERSGGNVEQVQENQTTAPPDEVSEPDTIEEATVSEEQQLRQSQPEQAVSPEAILAKLRAHASPNLVDLIGQMEDLAGQNRFIEAFRIGADAFGLQCEECLVDACLCVARMASRWDRDARIAPYALYENFDGLAASFGKHVREMRHIDPDPLRATSGLYHLATKIYFSWVEHCEAILEHQHRRTNKQWVQVEWVQPHKFNCLLNVMRSAVRIKLPLDLLLRIYQQLRQVIWIGKEAIALEGRKVKFEGDCLRTLASPSKDVIPDLCYIIYRDIIDTYVQAGENASALMFCDQALLIRRGDHEVEQIKADIIAKSGRQSGVSPRQGPHSRTGHFQ